MGFFLLGKRRDTGALQLLNGDLYSSRQDAIDALSEIDVPTDLESEVFAVDIDAATPVVVVQKKAARESVGDPAIADAIVEEADADAMADAETAAVFEAPAEEKSADLHGALKGAAASLEGEGIVAPESIGPAEGGSKAWPWDSEKKPPAEDVAEAELDEALAGVGAADAAAAELAGDEDVAEEAAIEEVAAEEEAALETEAVTEVPPPEFVPDPLEEPAVSVGDMVAMPHTEDMDASRTVVMGTYDEPGSAATEDVAEEAPTPPIAAAEPDDSREFTDSEPGGPEFGEPVVAPSNTKAQTDLESVLADLEIAEPMSIAPTEEDAPALEVPPEMAAEIPTPPIAEENASVEASDAPAEDSRPETPDLLVEAGTEDESTAPGFEGGDSDIAELTCDDCVYMNTCPKIEKGESDPASCGSFQWKSG